MTAETGLSEMRPGSWWRFLPIVAIAGGLALAYALGVQRYLSIGYLAEIRLMLKDYVAVHLLLAGLGFVALYAVATAFVFPAPAILTIAGGFLFGWWLGGALTVIGATIGGSALFLAARTAFGDLLRRRTGGAIERFASGFRRDAFSYLLVLRLTPVLPFAAVNIVPAFFDISLRSFALATFIGIIPGAMVYAFLGSGLGSALKAAGTASDLSVADLVTPQITIALVGLAALSVLGLILKKRALSSRVEEASHP